MLILALFATGLSISYAQGFEPPAEDKAVVYFVRPSGMGAAINFRYFDNDQYIGKFNGAKYMRYECEPGEHLFWARSENRDWITAELEAGKIYIVECKAQMGGFKARVQLVPVGQEDAKAMKKIAKLVNKKEPVDITEEELAEMNAELTEYIQESLEKYETKFKNERPVLHISPEMAYGK